MKKILLLLTIVLFLTGCGKEESAVEMMEQNSEESKSLEIISKTISEALSENQNLNYIENAAIDQLPTDISLGQIPKTQNDDVTGLYAFKDVAFMFVNHSYTKDTWSGILTKKKGSDGWIKLFSIPKLAYNPYSMSVSDGKLHLTIEEDSEINNSLHFFTTDGITWTEGSL